MAINDRSKYSIPFMQNRSFDEELQINTIELVGVDPAAAPGEELKRIKVNSNGELVTSSDLPTGAATYAGQQEIVTAIEGIGSSSSTGGATEDTQAEVLDELKNIQTTGIKEVEIIGSEGPLSQHQKEQSNSDQIFELLTYDTNIERVFGSQKLTNSKNRLELDVVHASDVVLRRALGFLNQELIINLDGQQSLAVQLSGTWAGTQSFTATVDYQNWVAIYGTNPAVLTAQVASATANGVTIFSVAGFKAFRVQTTAYTSGKCAVTLSASNSLANFKSQYVTGVVTAQGSQTQNIQQKATSFESVVYDNSTSTLSSALSPLQQWNPNCTTYQAGDWVMYNNQIYQCIAAPGSTVANMVPTNTTYWVLDKRLNRNLATNQYISSPDAQRLRVEIDMDGYQYRLSETAMLDQKIANWISMSANEGYESQGFVSMANYVQEEIR